MSKSFKIKLHLYLSSMVLYFVLVVVIKSDFTSNNFQSPCDWFFKNPTSLIACIFIVISLYSIRWLKKITSGPTDFIYKIRKIEIIKTDQLTFLTTCIFPLLSFTADDIKYIVINAVLVVIIGVVVIKNDFYYANPTLSILGYKLYSATLSYDKKDKEVIIITRDKLESNDKIKSLSVDNNVLIAWKGLELNLDY